MVHLDPEPEQFVTILKQGAGREGAMAAIPLGSPQPDPLDGGENWNAPHSVPPSFSWHRLNGYLVQCAHRIVSCQEFQELFELCSFEMYVSLED